MLCVFPSDATNTLLGKIRRQPQDQLKTHYIGWQWTKFGALIANIYQTCYEFRMERIPANIILLQIQYLNKECWFAYPLFLWAAEYKSLKEVALTEPLAYRWRAEACLRTIHHKGEVEFKIHKVPFLFRGGKRFCFYVILFLNPFCIHRSCFLMLNSSWQFPPLISSYVLHISFVMVW